MKVLISWLREFVDVPGTPEEIAATMSVRGFAVEGIERVDDLSHPSADGATADAVLDFEVTANRPDCMSVAGIAREVAAAYRLPLLAGPPAAEPALHRGAAESALQKMGRPGSAAGGPGEHPAAGGPGERPAAGGPGERPAAGGPGERPAAIDIVIDNPDLCPRYVGAVADVTVGPSPGWMQARLRAAGVRPISNIVDITNYVLIELGQPMHAFDHGLIGGAEIHARAARAGETIRTLDGQVRPLSPEMLVIADREKPIAIAGVMGGANSEVSDTTTTIVFESAYFDPLSVRRTSKKLGLKTEASMRFERGVDPQLPVVAMARACALLEHVGAGRTRGAMLDRYPTALEPRLLHLRRDRVSGLLGMTVPDADITRILESLGCALRASAAGWDVTVPTRRVDILREVDLIEEIARHYGFERVPARFPAVIAAPPRVDPRISRTRQLRAVMTGAGFFEAMTFGFIGEAAAASFAADGDLAPIANPLSENFGVLRPSALPGLIDAVAHNRRREQRDVRLFEIGAAFSKRFGERRVIACAWTGMTGDDHWSGGTRPVDFFDIKGVVTRIADAVGIDVDTIPHAESWLVPGRTAAVVANGVRLGVIGQLAPDLADRHGLPRGDAVYVAEIDLNEAEAISAVSVHVEPLPKFPSVTRDISILVDDTLSSAVIRRTVTDAAPATLARAREFDRYQGKGVPDGKISLSLRLTFRSLDRTLTDAEVQSAMDAVLAALRETHGAVQR
jgi:phenylalanyl-tRNA synthetase beta chain